MPHEIRSTLNILENSRLKRRNSLLLQFDIKLGRSASIFIGQLCNPSSGAMHEKHDGIAWPPSCLAEDFFENWGQVGGAFLLADAGPGGRFPLHTCDGAMPS